MKDKNGTLKGFTLIEMMLYVSICSILLLALTSMFSLLIGARIKNQTIAEVNQSGIQVMQLITQTIRDAKSINAPLAPSSSSTLSIKMNNAILDPTIFDIASGTIRIKEGTSTYTTITNSKVKASSLLFTNTTVVASTTDGGSVGISFVLTYVTTSSSSDYSYSKVFNGNVSFH
ncbi:prepilin-type N-terminal cleavage/methylation domain-containing protein [Candidatus Gracilibacteria bacterium]|nr:prepilin-type N-terminal cleavage/methylation domain-containing protein [Candidatus Gracilibacteria bacterium]MCF7898741.1 prepilin-type N-terminal cleavage/methylation domain-containing protein [Candidatus Paceibacterota bacterium]